MEMYKGTLYTIMGVDGFTVSRTDGVNVKFDAESFEADGIYLDAEEEIANLVMNDLDGFLNDGLDVVVSIERDADGDFIIDEVIEEVVYEEDDDEEYEDDEDDEDEEEEDDDTEFGYETDGPYATIEDEEE